MDRLVKLVIQELTETEEMTALIAARCARMRKMLALEDTPALGLGDLASSKKETRARDQAGDGRRRPGK